MGRGTKERSSVDLLCVVVVVFSLMTSTTRARTTSFQTLFTLVTVNETEAATMTSASPSTAVSSSTPTTESITTDELTAMSSSAAVNSASPSTAVSSSTPMTSVLPSTAVPSSAPVNSASPSTDVPSSAPMTSVSPSTAMTSSVPMTGTITTTTTDEPTAMSSSAPTTESIMTTTNDEPTAVPSSAPMTSVSPSTAMTASVPMTGSITTTTTDEPTAMSSAPTIESIMTTTNDEPTAVPSSAPMTSVSPSTESIMTTTTDEPTDAPRVGNLPSPDVPEIDGNPTKRYQFEFAVDETTTGGCTSSDFNSTECEGFKADIETELEELYIRKEGFKSVSNVTLRTDDSPTGGVGINAIDDVIVSHVVEFSYNDMSEQDRGASAQEIFDDTVGAAIDDGSLGNYTLVEECDSCGKPQELTDDLCELDVDCSGAYSRPVCRETYWVCESVCDTAYCNGHGICWQEQLNQKPTCSCDWDDDHWYWGYSCQHYANQMHLIIGCSCGGAVFIVLLVVLIGCACTGRCTGGGDKTAMSENGDRIQEEFLNMAYDHTENFPPIDDGSDVDIVSRSRPYSYIYTASPNNLVMPKENSDEAAAKRQSRTSSERNSVAPKPAEPSPKPADPALTRGPEFWGNLSETGGSGEHVPLQPTLDHIDVNERYAIQRPKISLYDPSRRPVSSAFNNYTYGNGVSTDRSQSARATSSQAFPEPDYGQIR